MRENPGKIITFYSYKGGTGRSMALANVAYLLATDISYGRNRVLMIDWDLEAPGLHRYFQLDQSETSAWQPGKSFAQGNEKWPGLIDLFHLVHELYRKLAPSGGLPESESHSDVAREIFQKLRMESLFRTYVTPISDIANLELLTAGSLDSYYANRVRSFPWEEFYKKYGSFFSLAREQLMNDYDYVLIDSRTGITDISGLCTRVMPEKLVAVFAPNRQNIDGIVDVIRRSDAHRSASRDPRSLLVFPLASRIDAAASYLRTLWWKGGIFRGQTYTGYQKIFENLFSELYELDSCDLSDYFNATYIPHDSDYAYGEEIAVRSQLGTSDKASIGHACANLTERLVKLRAPWEKLPEVELKEALRQATASTQRVEELEQERSLWMGRTIQRSGLFAIVPLILLIGAVSAFVPPVLADRKFFWIGGILTAGVALLFALAVPLWSRGRIVGALLQLLVGAAFIIGGTLTGWWWWGSRWSPSQPASRAASKLLMILNQPDGAMLHVNPTESPKVKPSRPAQELAVQLAAAVPKYSYILLVNDAYVPLQTFSKMLYELSGEQHSGNSQLEGQFGTGLGPFRFGMSPTQVSSAFAPWLMAVPEAGSISVPLSNLAPMLNRAGEQPTIAGFYSWLPWFHACWGGQSSITFLSSNSRLTEISIRLFQDCPERLDLLNAFAHDFGLPVRPNPGVIPFQVILPQSTVAATNGEDFASLEIFANESPQPAAK